MKQDPPTTQTITNVGLRKATALSVDWLGDSIYWINEQANRYARIEQIGIKGNSRRTVIWGDQLNEPYELKVDPIAGFIFWTDWKKRISPDDDRIRIISRATMAGDQITPLASNRFNTVGDRIKHITLDYRNKGKPRFFGFSATVSFNPNRAQMIYYVDYDKENIQAISYYQKLVDKPKVISQATGNGVPRIPAFYDKILYWTSHLERSKSSKWTIEGINTTSHEKLKSIPLSGVDDIGDMMLK